MHPALRWTARIGAGLATVLVVGAGTVYGLSERRLRARFPVPEHALVVRDDSATVAHGRHVATIRGCTDCHGAALAGSVMADDPAFGRIASANLTRGGRGGALAPADWERAVRHGVRRDGSPLLIMPSHEYHVLSDEDLGAVVAFARSLPAVTASPPPTRVGPVARALYVGGKLPLVAAELVRHETPHVARAVPAPTAAYGAYVASGCVGCHGDGLSGGSIPGGPPDWPAAANITPAGIGTWTEADFARALRTGRRPDGRMLNPAMPYRSFAKMTDVEVRAIYAYLRTVPPRPTGTR